MKSKLEKMDDEMKSKLFETDVEVKIIDLGWMLSEIKGFKHLAISIQDHPISGDITETESY